MKPINLEKQFRFAVASALTKTAKAAQAASLKEIRKDFTVRTNWLEPANAKGIKVLPARKDDLSAAVVTRAEWLIEHETGEDKVAPGKHLAVARAARPSKTTAMKLRDLPRQLKNSFVITTKTGRKFIAVRKGRGKNKSLRLMFQLIAKRARIKKQSTIVEPMQKTIQKQFSNTLFQELKKAISTAK